MFRLLTVLGEYFRKGMQTPRSMSSCSMAALLGLVVVVVVVDARTRCRILEGLKERDLFLLLWWKELGERQMVEITSIFGGGGG